MSCSVLLASPWGSFEALKFDAQIAVFEVPRGPGGVKMGPQRPLGPFLERLGLMDASWSGLGDLLERSWTALGPKKTCTNICKQQDDFNT